MASFAAPACLPAGRTLHLPVSMASFLIHFISEALPTFFHKSKK